MYNYNILKLKNFFNRPGFNTPKVHFPGRIAKREILFRFLFIQPLFHFLQFV